MEIHVQPNDITTRMKWLDIAKGLGIIAVVFGHSGNPYAFTLFWFHMPLFFFLSGYVHKEQSSLKILICKKTKQLLIPYVCFYLLILIIQKVYLFGPFKISKLDILNLIKGGQYLTGFFGPFWFITVLYLTIILFEVLLKLKSLKKMAFIIFISYISSYLISQISNNYIDYRFYWNIDVVFMAIVFYVLGFYYKKYNIKIGLRYLVSCFVLIFIVLISFKLDIFKYYLDMKASKYNSFLIDILIPMSFIVIIIFIAWILERLKYSNLFILLGKHSLVIMYLHIPINIILESFIPYNDLGYLLVGILVPFLVSYYVLNRLSITQRLFLGRFD